MEKILRSFESHKAADEAARRDDDALSVQERFRAFLQLMAPYYAAAPRFQRVYRIDDLKQRRFRDDWGLRIQSISQSSDHR